MTRRFAATLAALTVMVVPVATASADGIDTFRVSPVVKVHADGTVATGRMTYRVTSGCGASVGVRIDGALGGTIDFFDSSALAADGAVSAYPWEYAARAGQPFRLRAYTLYRATLDVMFCAGPNAVSNTRTAWFFTVR